MKKWFSIFLRGIPIGLSLTLPGVSGGTVALILGLYDRIILGIKTLNVKFLLPILLGSLIGIWAGSGFITFLLEQHHNITVSFLLGLVLFSTKVTLGEVKIYNLHSVLILLIFLVLGLFLWNYSVEEISGNSPSYIQLLIAGFVSSVAMILPGISGATLLIILGLYGGVLEAVKEFNFLVLFFYGLGALAGLFSFSWVLSYLLKNHRSLTMMSLTGLILASTRAVIPKKLGILEFLAFLLGALLILILSNDKFKKHVRKLTN
jgi:putative membrane protein